jgi:nucleotide-binding universal stress UspA family protein
VNQKLSGRHIVVGVHGSPSSLAALRWAAREAALWGAKLVVVRAWEDQAQRWAPYASRGSRPAGEQDRRLAGAQLADTVRATAGDQPGVRVTGKVVEGLAARVLLDQSAGADLLVLGSAGKAGAHAVGPVARACLRHARCPVVVVSASMSGVPVPA